MSDEWKVSGSEPENGQQTVNIESADCVEKSEQKEIVKESRDTEQVQNTEEIQDTEDVPVEETVPEVKDDRESGENQQTETRYPWEAVLGKEEAKEKQPSTETSDSSYHWVNPEYQKRQNSQGTEENSSQNTYENQNYRDDVSSSSVNNQSAGNNEWGQPVNNNSEQKGDQTGEYQNGNWGCAGSSQKAPNGNDQAAGYSWNQQERKEGPVTGQRKYGNYTYYQQPDHGQQSPTSGKSGGTGKKVLLTAGLAVLFGAIAGGMILGANFLVTEKTQTEQQKTEIQLPSTELPKQENAAGNTGNDTEAVSAGTAGEYTVAQVAKSCMPSVVSITNASVKNVQDFFGGVQEYPIESSGSGIIVGQSDSEILIATNNHVVADANTITVAFSDDEVYEAQIKGTDSDNDLAVIAVKIADISEDTMNSIKVVSIGNSDELEIGEQVVAIGNALGYGQSVTSGWVSAVNREMTDEDGKTTGKLIQTDAAINPGNSGGALLNMQGELIGINSAKAAATEVEGMGYAIPVSVAQPILDELMNRETRYKADEAHAAYIGVTCLNVDSTSAQTYGIPLGAFVDSVEEGGPAQTAGIQKGDVITKFDGMTVSGSSDLVGKLEYYQAGEIVDVVISRAQNGEYQEQTVSVTLGKRSEMKQTDPQAGK